MQQCIFIPVLCRCYVVLMRDKAPKRLARAPKRMSERNLYRSWRQNCSFI